MKNFKHIDTIEVGIRWQTDRPTRVFWNGKRQIERDMEWNLYEKYLLSKASNKKIIIISRQKALLLCHSHIIFVLNRFFLLSSVIFKCFVHFIVQYIYSRILYAFGFFLSFGLDLFLLWIFRCSVCSFFFIPEAYFLTIYFCLLCLFRLLSIFVCMLDFSISQ